MKKYNYIVIWSGLWWLSVASLLAQENKKVLVLEKHYLTWWFATNFKRKDYEFDVSLHQTWWINKTFYNKILKKCWVFDKIQWIKDKYLYEKQLWNEIIKIPNGNISEIKKVLYKKFPSDKKVIFFYFAFMNFIATQLKIWEYWNDNYFTSLIVRICAPILCPFILFSHKLKIDTIFNRIKNPELKKVLLTFIWYYNEDTKDVAFNPFFFAEYWYYFDWWHYVKWWGQNFSNAFIKVIKSNGWEIQILKNVTEIIEKDKKVIWVKTDKWEKFFADNIICNASPIEVYDKMLKKSKNIKRNHIEKMKIGMSFIGAYIWLNCKIEELNKKFKDSYEIFFDDLTITIHSNLDKNLCHKNKSTMDVFIASNVKGFFNLSEKDYKIKKADLKNLIISRLEKHFKWITKYIEVFEVATPKTIDKFTNNKNWEIYWFKNIVGQSGFDRFDFQDKNFKNLYFSSAYTIFGWGYEWAIRNWYFLNEILSWRDKNKKNNVIILICIIVILIWIQYLF